MNKLQLQALGVGLLALAVGGLSAFNHPRADVQRETRPVGAFTEISLGGSARVVLRQGSPQSVVVEARPEALAEFETEVSDRRLRLGYRRPEGLSWRMKDRGPVTVFVTAPALTALRVGGSGQLEVSGPLQADALALAVSGSGRLLVPALTASSLETAVSGSGDVRVAGRCPRQEVRISGSGSVQAHELKTETSTVRISGSGGAHVFASQAADARISGSGTVFVAGGGTTSSTRTGSGRLVKE